MNTRYLLETVDVSEALNQAKVLIEQGIASKTIDGKLSHVYYKPHEFRTECRNLHGLTEFVEAYGCKKSEYELISEYSRLPFERMLTKSDQKLMERLEVDYAKAKDEHNKRYMEKK